MFFSFIVPVYNTSKYLEQCIESLLSQKGSDYEILLIDDGSTDRSGRICDAYAESYPDAVCVVHKKNEGLLMTRRRGFKEAKGDWFICIDSDDYVDKELLESVVAAIGKYHPDMVMYNFNYVNDAGEESKSRLQIPDGSVYECDEKQYIFAKRLLTDDINSLCLKAVKREIVDLNTDYSNCIIRNMAEDAYQVLPLLSNASRIVYLNSPLYYYRKGHDSITATKTYDVWLASKVCFLKTEEYLDIWKVSDELRHRFYTRYTEVLSNFIRWLFAQSENSLPDSLSNILHLVHDHPAFERCINMYNKAYAKTSYLRFCVPLIMKYVKKENLKGLRRYFILENIIRSGR